MTDLYLMLYLLLLLAVSTKCHSCRHQVPKPDEVVHGVDLEAHHVIRKRSISQNLRIRIIFDCSLNDLDKQKKVFIEDVVLPKAVEYWQKTLKVRKTSRNIRLLRQCSSKYIQYKPGDPYHYCVGGCKNVTMCGDVQVPEEHLDYCRMCPKGLSCRIDETDSYRGSGIEGADFVLYVSTKKTERCGYGTTVAYAAYCQLEGAFDRPVAGYVNICPSSISLERHDVTQVISTIKHEILHALGFSAGLYAFYRDKEGEPLTPRLSSTGKPAFNKTMELYQWSNRVVKEVIRPHWKIRTGFIEHRVQMIVTPRVINETRKHFNCSTLEGAEVENQGIVGTALTHWEKRVFENEAMTGTYTQNPLISRITLALMEDTGWYKADYSQAQDLQWGKNLGCDFVKKSCLHWMDKQKRKKKAIHPFCKRVKLSSGLQTECTDSLKAMALCNLVEYDEPLPQQYQYFNKLPNIPKSSKLAHFGGAVLLADFCPYIQEFNWRKGGQVVRGSRCDIASNQAGASTNYAVESYGNQSVCIEQARPWLLKECDRKHRVQHWGSGCYQVECTKTGVVIIVNNVTYHCYKSGQRIIVKTIVKTIFNTYLHEGILICPPCKDICQEASTTYRCPSERDAPLRLDTIDISIPCCSNSIVTPIYYYMILVSSLLIISLLSS
ncbi:leishmanolysin-like peptidase [Tubulanus polymorphus]|uniref:leishmanolysin-like peptidase n=1 Tax=Tubulanus polymorphus TaxID=672921 RepID=UPI003DA4B78D